MMFLFFLVLYYRQEYMIARKILTWKTKNSLLMPTARILEHRISSFLLTKYPERYSIEVLILGGKGDMNN